MHIGAVCRLDGEVPYEAYKASVEAKLARLPRFRERVVQAPLFLGHPTWETDHDFDISNHVLLHEVPAPGNEKAMSAVINEIIATPLDRSRPLWELHILHGLRDGTSTIVSKVHHAMVDGVGGNAILTTILDLNPRAEIPQYEDDYEPSEPGSTGTRVLDALWDSARSALDSMYEYQTATFEGLRSFDRHRLTNTLELIREAAPELARPPRRLPFNGRCKGERSLVWTEFSFAEARAVRSALGGTVNDLILSCLAGAVGRYSEEHGVKTRGRTMRVMVPVNVRPADADADLGNLVSVLPVDLPLDVKDVRHRIGLIRERTRVLKRGRVAEGVNVMTSLLGAVPPPLQAGAGALAASPFPVFNIVCTNVPGPQIPLYALGHRLLAYYPYVPVGFDMGVGCAIFSYDQTLHVGFNSDTNACPDVEVLRDAFDAELENVRQTAGVQAIPKIVIGKTAPKTGSSRKNARPATRKAKTGSTAAKKVAKKAKKKAAKKNARKKPAKKPARKSGGKKTTKKRTRKKTAARKKRA